MSVQRLRRRLQLNQWRGVLAEFKDFLPVTKKTPPLSLNEGNTALVKARNIHTLVGFTGELHFKLEGQNPTGSFKDRGMVVAVAKALEEGSRAIICASTGNTAASAAAYAARAGIGAIAVLPKGKVAKGKLTQAVLYGAIVIEVDGNFDDAARIAREVARAYAVTLVNSVNPYRLEGQKTAAFEIYEQLGRRFPDFHFIPVGNAGNITAYWMGYKEYQKVGRRRCLNIASWMVDPVSLIPPSIGDFLDSHMPRMMGYQAAGAAPIVMGHVIENPRTMASAIQIGNPARWKEAEQAVCESQGLIDAVTDEEIMEAYRMLPAREGIFCEPASAASLAGFLKAWKEKRVPPGSIVVCTLTGHGLKDPDTSLSAMGTPVRLPADTRVVAEFLQTGHHGATKTVMQ